jgi:Bifunctional DNA primase/polymerase, N-terminal/AAA domain
MTEQHIDNQGPEREKTRAAARRYIEADLAPIPIPHGEKNPNRRGWEKERHTTADVERLWSNGQNIGLLLGAPSRGLVDIDLDRTEARAVAEYLLPKTRTSGRTSCPDSHRWYYCNPLPKTKPYKLPGKVGDRCVVELRSTGAQTVVYPSKHPSGDRYEWGQGAVSTVDGQALADAVEDVAAAALLLMNYPGQGARHDYVMAAAGYLGRHMEPKRVRSIVRAVVACSGDDEADTRFRDIDDTLEKLAAGDPVTGGPTLDDLAPGAPRQLTRWKITPRDQSGADGDGPHDDEDQDGQAPEGHTNRLLADRLDLTRRIKEGVPPPDYHEPGILLRGMTHLFFAAAGQGKTLLALWLAKQAINRGETVLFLDAENGWKIVAERLQAMDVDVDALAERFCYLPYPTLALDTDSVSAYREALDIAEPDLIVFDSWLNFLSQCGLDENSPVDIERWGQAFLKPARQRGLTTAVLDHVPHDADRPRGSGRKIDLSDVIWKVRQSTEFDRDTLGQITLYRRKDRECVMPSSVLCAVGGDGTGQIIFRPDTRVVEDEHPEDGLKPSQRKALEILRGHFGEGGAAFNEWLKAYKKETSYSKASFTRAVPELLHKKLVYKADNDRYYVGLITPPPKRPNETSMRPTNETSTSGSGLTEVSRDNETDFLAWESQKADSDSEGLIEVSSTNETAEKPEVSFPHPPFIGGGDETGTRETLALEALEASSEVRRVAVSCAAGAFDKEHRLGASAYQGGSVGVLAGAIATYHGETGPDAWREWMHAAGVALDRLAEEVA